MRVIFAGTPDFAVAPLQVLLAEHEVVAVFTQPDRRSGRGKKLQPPPVKQLALKHKVPVHQPTSLKDQAELIAELAADVMVVVAYGMLLPPTILALPRLGCINIHASLLPRWRGAAPIQRAIEAGDRETGVAIMQMEAGLDTGPVFAMLTTEIGDQDTSATLHDKLAKLGAKGISSTLAALADNPKLEPTPQNHQHATYAHKLSKQDAAIEWQSTAAQIHNQHRAFIPWPGSETYHGDTRIRVWQAHVEPQQAAQAAPGTIIALEPEILVACGEGTLSLTSLQRDGGKPLSSREFRNGYELLVGDQLGNKPHG